MQTTNNNRKRTYDAAHPEIPVSVNRKLEFENMVADYQNQVKRARNTGYAGESYICTKREAIIEFSNEHSCASARNIDIVRKKTYNLTAVTFPFKLASAKAHELVCSTFHKQINHSFVECLGFPTISTHFAWLFGIPFFARMMATTLITENRWQQLNLLLRASRAFNIWFYTSSEMYYLPVVARMVAVEDFAHLWIIRLDRPLAATPTMREISAPGVANQQVAVDVAKSAEEFVPLFPMTDIQHILDHNPCIRGVLEDRFDAFRKFTEIEFRNAETQSLTFTPQSYEQMDIRVLATLVGNYRIVHHLLRTALVCKPISEPVKRQLIVASLLTDNYTLHNLVLECLDLSAFSEWFPRSHIHLAIALRVSCTMFMSIVMRYDQDQVEDYIDDMISMRTGCGSDPLGYLTQFKLSDKLTARIIKIACFSTTPDIIINLLFERQSEHVRKVMEIVRPSDVQTWDEFAKGLHVNKQKLFNQLRKLPAVTTNVTPPKRILIHRSAAKPVPQEIIIPDSDDEVEDNGDETFVANEDDE